MKYKYKPVNVNAKCIQVILSKDGPGDFGMGIYLTKNNIITEVQQHGRVYIADDSIVPGYKVTKVNNQRIPHNRMLVDHLKKYSYNTTVHVTFEL